MHKPIALPKLKARTMKSALTNQRCGSLDRHGIAIRLKFFRPAETL